MTNTGKALIVGLVLLDLGFVSYLMLPKDDEQSKKAPEAELTQPVGNAGFDPRSDDTHVTEGSVTRTPQSTTAIGKITGASNAAQAPKPSRQPPVQQAQQPPQPQQAPATAAPEARETFAANPIQIPQPQIPQPTQPAPATAPAQAQESFAANPNQVPQPQIPQQKKSAPAAAPAQARQSFAVKPVPAQQYARTHDDLGRRGSNPVAAALTQQLVNESAKPDPSLPMPTMPLTPPAQTAPDYQDRHGANPTAAAMTQQLVRESAKPDPSLPMPPSAPAVQSPPIYQEGHGPNAVAAAMTEELVRRSATISPPSQPASRSGTQ